MKPPCHLAFANLEHALESSSLLIATQWRDSVYLLLWELGTNILKYGINDLYAKVVHTHLSSSYPQHALDSTLHILTRHLPQGALYLAFNYLVALPRFYLVSKPTPHLAQPTPSAPNVKQDFTHHHNLGHKVIKRYAEIFCYNAPQFMITSARHRTISMIIKGQYLAIYHSKTK
ncbi:hypothetical protein [Helicobacter sp.]|uniref:hypothetical protein n=1 Tax=Helicobacter sp. TaxID=218 RepID=UPI0025C211C9|nr:hypothetical protein [Helicobacter sp.]MBR2495263.1 hypothetical protein [Helicobacter sp.]